MGTPKKKKVVSLSTSDSKQDISASVSKSALIINNNNNNNDYDDIDTNNNTDNGITSSSISKPSPFGGGNSMVEAAAETARKKASLQKLNNNNIDNDITSSSISTPCPFGDGNAMAEAVTEAARKKANLQKLSCSGSITSLYSPKSNSNNSHDDNNNKERTNTNQLRRGFAHASITANTLDCNLFRVNETITTNNSIQKQRKLTTFFPIVHQAPVSHLTTRRDTAYPKQIVHAFTNGIILSIPIAILEHEGHTIVENSTAEPDPFITKHQSPIPTLTVIIDKASHIHPPSGSKEINIDEKKERSKSKIRVYYSLQ